MGAMGSWDTTFDLRQEEAIHAPEPSARAAAVLGPERFLRLRGKLLVGVGVERKKIGKEGSKGEKSNKGGAGARAARMTVTGRRYTCRAEQENRRLTQLSSSKPFWGTQDVT
jgi:ferredoxin-NADP reductase